MQQTPVRARKVAQESAEASVSDQSPLRARKVAQESAEESVSDQSPAQAYARRLIDWQPREIAADPFCPNCGAAQPDSRLVTPTRCAVCDPEAAHFHEAAVKHVARDYEAQMVVQIGQDYQNQATLQRHGLANIAREGVAGGAIVLVVVTAAVLVGMAILVAW